MASNAPASARSRWPVALLLVALTVVAYLPALHNGFVWDDDTSVTGNRLVKSDGGLSQLWFSTRNPDYWPVTETTFWAEWRLWGLNAAGYHATNLGLHIAEVLLLWAILRRLRIPGAGVAAAIFAVHPVNVESVAWITQRKNLMAMLFYLLSIWFFLRVGSQTKGSGRQLLNPAAGFNNWRPDPFYALSLACFVLAMLGKGSVAILPLVLLGIVAWRRRLEWRDAFWVAPFFAVAGGLTLVDLWFQAHQLAAAEVIRQAGPIERLLGAGAVVWFYLFKAVLPLNLVFVYPQWHIDAGNVLWWIPPVAAVAMTFLLFKVGRIIPNPPGPSLDVDRANGALGILRQAQDPVMRPTTNTWLRALLFTWLYFCAALLPAMGFTDVYFMKFSLVADHYQHLALLGIVAAAGAGWAAWRAHSRAADAAAAVVICAFAVLTWRQCLLYRDSGVLFEDVLRKNPGSSMAHNNLGVVLADRRDLPGALAQFDEALHLEPDYADARRNFGLTLAREGHPAEAIPYYESALRLRPNYPDAHDDLGNALLTLDRPAEAAAHYEQSIRLSPDDAEAEGNLGIALIRLGKMPEAITHLDAAVRIDPDNPALQSNLADTLAQAGRSAEAIPHYQAVLRLRPEDTDARNNLETARRALAGASPPP